MAFSKNKNTTIADLERILLFGVEEADKDLIKTVLDTCVAAQDVSQKCTSKLHPLHYHSEKGHIFYIGHNEKSTLKINGKLAEYVTGDIKIGTPEGRKYVRNSTGVDGAIEILYAEGGRINSRRRMFHAAPDEVAYEKGVIKEGEDVTPEALGFKDNGSGFTRQLFAISATGRDPKMYVITVSGKTGDIRVMHDYEIVLSTEADEIPEKYALFLNPEGRLYNKRTKRINPAIDKDDELFSSLAKAYTSRIFA